MTHLQFRRMDEHNQFATIDKSGVLLFNRKEKFHTVQVYQVNSFFVEVHVHSHFNVPLKVKSYPAAHKNQSTQLYLHLQQFSNN